MENNQLGPQPAAAPTPPLGRARGRVLAAIRDDGGAVTLTELSETTGLHVNTLRPHLDALTDHGLLQRDRAAPSGRGRPAFRWRVAPAQPSEYAGLAATLARTLKATSSHPAGDAVEAGRAWGRDLAASHPSPPGPGRATDARSQTIGLLTELGFAPETATSRARAKDEVRLTRCPLLEAAKEEPTIVCNVHLGLVAGALEGYDAADPDVQLAPFAAPGACLLQLSAG